jgi:hypothetical protein
VVLGTTISRLKNARLYGVFTFVGAIKTLVAKPPCTGVSATWAGKKCARA